MSDFFGEHFQVIAVGFDEDKTQEIQDKIMNKIVEEITND